jgi:WD40 repeat protein
MGVVYKARQVSLGREVALKMILAGGFASETDIKRFRREAEAAAGLEHPNIVPIHEVGEYQGRHYFSMKLVEGESLSSLIPNFRRDLRGTAVLTASIARAVHYAHQRGILHRDLKPANILIDSNGAPQITDFGLAVRIQSGSDLTLSGTILGTPGYMAPEQAAGDVKRLSTAADIYSLGAILYHLITQRPPFSGDSIAQVLHNVIEEDPIKPRLLAPGVDPDLETICLKCLDKDPARRYGSAEALAEDLEHWLRLEPIRARPAATWELLVKWVRRKPVVAALTAALVCLGLVAFGGITSLWQRSERKANESRQRLVRLNVVNGTRLVREGDQAGGLLWYTEALRLDEGDPAQEEMHRIRLGSLLEQMPHLKKIWIHPNPVWLAQLSPNGGLLASISGRDAVTNRFQGADLRVWPNSGTGAAVARLTFSGGRPPIRRIRYQVFSPNGQQVATVACRDIDGKTVSEIQICAAASGQPVLTPLKLDGVVSDVAFSPDGTRLAAASKAGMARIWNLKQDGEPGPILAHKGWVTVVAFSPDGRRLATGSRDKTVRIWDVQSGEPTTPTLPHGRQVLDAQFSHDGLRLVTTASDESGGEFHVWDVASGERLRSVDNPQGRIENVIFQITFSPDDKQVLTASMDGTAVVWDASSGRQMFPPFKHDDGVLTAVFSQDGHSILTAAFDRTARLWSLPLGGAQVAMLNHCDFILGAFFSASARQVVTFGMDGMVREWELPLGPPGVITLRHTNEVLYAEFSPDGRRIVTASRDRTARVWDAQTGKPLTPPLTHDGAVNHASFSPDGQRVVTASTDGTARIWEVATGMQVGPSLLHSNNVWHAAFDPKGERVVTACGSFRDLNAASSLLFRDFSTERDPKQAGRGEVRVWDVRTGSAVTKPMPHGDAALHAEFSPDGRTIVSTAADGSAQLWNPVDGSRLGPPMKHTSSLIFGATFSPDGKLIATASGGAGTLEKAAARIWNARTGKPFGRPFEHFDLVYSALFSRDGRRLITGSEDATARVWDVRTGEPLTPPIANGSIVLRAEFSPDPDGRFVLTAGLDGNARVWNAANGEFIAQLRLHLARINAASFSPDGTRLLTASDDGTAKICPLPNAASSMEDLTLLAQVFSARRIAGGGTQLEPLDPGLFKTAWSNLCQRFPDQFFAVEVPGANH